MGQLTCTSICASNVCHFIVTVELLAPHLNLKMDAVSSGQEISLAGEHWVVIVGNWSNVS